MSAFPFLDLAVELVEQILLSADVPTILRVMQTARLIHAFVCGSEEIQYKIQLYYHGCVDAPRTSTTSYAHRRTQLDNFRRQWVITEPTRNETLYLSSKFYVLERGVFAMLSRSSNRFFITRSQGPNRGIRPLSWKTPSLDFKIFTFGMDLTVNLLAVFGAMETDESCVAQIRLLTLTDCTPCPLSALPVLKYPGFPDCRHIQDSGSKILISGPWLGLTWREVLDSSWERLSIWNWKSGNVRLYIERVLAFSFISDKYLLTVHQEHISVYDLSKRYPLFNRLDPSTEPIPVYRLALPEICHAAGLHRSGSLDYIPGSPFVPSPPDVADVLLVPSPAPNVDTSSGFHDEGTLWEGTEVPFCEDPSRNILAVNLIRYVGHWPRVAGTMGTTIIIPLQRLVDFAEEAVTKSTTDVIGKVVKRTEVHAEARDKAETQMYVEPGRAQSPGIPQHHTILELVQLERRRTGLIRTGHGAVVTTAHGSTRAPHKPRCFRPAWWLKHALVFNQETHNRLYDYRKSVVSGSRFVSSIEVRERKRVFQLIDFNPTWVNALEQRLGHSTKDAGVHYKAVECGHPILRLVERNWETEGLIVPMTFEEYEAANSDFERCYEDSVDSFPDIHFGSDDEEYAFLPPLSPVTPTAAPTLSPSSIGSETDHRRAEIDSSQPSWYGWRVARCGEVKYAWKVIPASRNMIALDVAIQEDSLIYTAIEDYSSGAHVYFSISSF